MDSGHPVAFFHLRWRQTFRRNISTFANANSNARLQLAKNPYAFAYRIVPEQILNIFPAMLINEVRTFCRIGG